MRRVDVVQIYKHLSIVLFILAFFTPLHANATSAYGQFGGIQALVVHAYIDRNGAKLLGRTRSIGISNLAVRHLKQHAIWKKLGIVLRDRKFPALPPEIKKTRVLNVSFRISLLKHHDGTLFSVITSAWSRMYYSRGEELHQETLPFEPYLFSFDPKKDDQKNFQFIVDQLGEKLDREIIKGIRYRFRLKL